MGAFPAGTTGRARDPGVVSATCLAKVPILPGAYEVLPGFSRGRRLLLGPSGGRKPAPSGPWGCNGQRYSRRPDNVPGDGDDQSLDPPVARRTWGVGLDS